MKHALIFILAIFATQCSADFVNTLLNAQNAYRTVLNIAPLTWSNDLAASAQLWANHLADIGSLVHSGSKNGENLAYISGTYTGDTGDSTSDGNTDNTDNTNNVDNNNTDNTSTDNSNTNNGNTDNSDPVTSNTADSNTDNSNNANNNNGDDNSNSGGFLSSQPVTAEQPQDNSQGSVDPSTESAQPRQTRWSKKKTDHLEIHNTYTGDGGSSDENSGGRRLSSNGRRLSQSDSGDADLVRLVGLWGAEKQYFVYGNFPDVSTTGSWQDVGHYTQLVWAATQQVGCGIANGNGNEYLVCQYYPAGNWDGEPVY